MLGSLHLVRIRVISQEIRHKKTLHNAKTSKTQTRLQFSTGLPFTSLLHKENIACVNRDSSGEFGQM